MLINKLKQGTITMKKLNIFSKAAVLTASIALAAGIVFSSTRVNAIPYVGDDTPTSPVPAFNVYTGDVPQFGDERNFLQVHKVGEAYTDNLSSTCEADETFQMRVYVHNGAGAGANNNGTGPSVAHGTKVKVTLPNGEADSFTSSAQISADNAATVSDTTVINCNGKTVKLTYVAGSAKAKLVSANQYVALGDSIVSTGVPINSQLNGVPGDVWGCWDDRILVLLTVKVEEVEEIIPVYSCDLLSVNKLADNKYRFSVTYTAKDGAVFQNVTYSFGDGTTVTNGATTEHTYTASTEVKNVNATVNFMVDGESVSASSTNCNTKVTLTKDNCPVPGKENLPKNDAGCKDNCVVKGKEHLPKNDPNCKETVKPASLPNTGAGSTIAIFLGASFIGAFLYRMRVLRGIN